MSRELVISPPGEPIVALAMTGAAFGAAQEQGITRVEADLQAMEAIARHVGALPSRDVLGPMVIVMRDSLPNRNLRGNWDGRLPRHQGNPQTDRYFAAAELASDRPATGSRGEIVTFARSIGAEFLVEMSIPGWDDDARRQHPAAFADAVLLGQRPLDLPPKPPVWKSIGKEVVGSLTGSQSAVNMVNRLRGGKPQLAEPFRVTSATKTGTR